LDITSLNKLRFAQDYYHPLEKNLLQKIGNRPAATSSVSTPEKASALSGS